MALASNALTTTATLADELGITPAAGDVARLERYINQASEAIERFLGRKLQKTTRTEKLAPSGTLRLVLANTPLSSITSIVEDGTTVDSDDYAIEDAEAGIVVADEVWGSNDLVHGIAQDAVRGTGKRDIVVTYIGGYVLPNDGGTRDLPHDIEAACLITAASLYRARGADRRIASEAVGDASVTYGGVNTAIGRGAGGIIPDEAAVLLQAYRRVVMA
jgi:hypothetical protein